MGSEVGRCIYDCPWLPFCNQPVSGQQQEMQSFKCIVGCFTLCDGMIKAEVGKLHCRLYLATIG